RETSLAAAQQPRDVVGVLRQELVQRVARDLPAETPEPPPDQRLMPVDERLQLTVELSLPAAPRRRLGSIPGGIDRAARAVGKYQVKRSDVVRGRAPGHGGAPARIVGDHPAERRPAAR